MKLSEISILLELLKKTNIDAAWIELSNQLQAACSLIAGHVLQIGSVTQDLDSNFDTVANNVHSFKQTLAYLITQLENIIVQREPEYYQNSLRLYEEEMRWETNDYILNRKLIIDNDSNMIMRNRIKAYSDWRLPGLIIRPGLETFIEEMVPLDPLYVVDQHPDLLRPAIDKFTPEYQRRLRTYTINDYIDDYPLWALPDGQFGLIFAYNFLNYKPLGVVETYLKEFYKKLRPGGVVIFTYNNCDLPQGMAFAERYFMCYTPGKAVCAIADQIGFDNLNDSNQGKNDVSWLELKKPGDITSMKGGQTLARIVRK